jgi:hypothetical protein
MPSFASTRASFAVFIFILNAIFTGLSIWRPYINAFAQMFLVAVPLVTYLYLELKKIKKSDKEVYNLGIRSLIVGVGSEIIFYCSDGQSLGSGTLECHEFFLKMS